MNPTAEELELLICDKLGMFSNGSTESLAEALEQLFKSSLPPSEGAEFVDRWDAEAWLGENKDIWNHPRVTDRTDKESYEVADLMAEFTNFHARRLADKMVIERMKDKVLKLSDEIDKEQSERLLSDKERVDKMVSERLREELMNFARTFNDKMDGPDCNYISVTDEYLKSRESK